jgi:hypothetical protein
LASKVLAQPVTSNGPLTDAPGDGDSTKTNASSAGGESGPVCRQGSGSATAGEPASVGSGVDGSVVVSVGPGDAPSSSPPHAPRASATMIPTVPTDPTRI